MVVVEVAEGLTCPQFYDADVFPMSSHKARMHFGRRIWPRADSVIPLA